MVLEIITIVIGAVYGYLKPGKEDRRGLFKKGVLIGIILGLIFLGMGILGGEGFLLLGGMMGAVVFLEVIILAILFIIGTFIGDWLEERSKSKAA